MKFNDKSLIRNFAIALCIGNALAYSLFHLTFLLFNIEPWGIVFEFARTYLTEIWEFLFPCAIALLMLIVFSVKDIKSSLIAGVLLSLSRYVYAIPFYYIRFISNGYDSLESLGFSALFSSAVTAFAILQSYVLFAIMYAIFKSKNNRQGVGENLNSYTLNHLSGKSFTDTLNPSFFALSTVVFIQFLKYTILEIVDTVKFFIEYGSSYSLGEILSILLSYIFIIAMSIGMYFILVLIKNKIFKNRFIKEETEI